MPTTTPLGQSIPAPGDTADPVAWFAGYSMSDIGVTVVASRTQANTVRAQAPGRAVVVWRTDLARLELHPNTGAPGEAWEFLGGRRHEATVTFSRTLTANPSTPLVLHGQSVTDASPGFTFSGPDAQNVVLPAAGWWRFQATANLEGAAATVGRTFFQFHDTSGEVRHRIAATNENNYGGDVEAYFPAGAAVRIQAFHEGGGSRLWTAQVHVKWDGPRWGQ